MCIYIYADLGLLELRSHLSGSLLRLCQRVDQSLILQNIPSRLRKQAQNVALNLRHLFVHRRIVHHELILHLREIRTLFRDHCTKQLLNQPVLSDGEIEQRDLDCGLRRVIRVPELGCDIEKEVFMVRHRTVAQIDHILTTLFVHLFQQQWLERRVELFLDVFEQHGLAETDGVLQRA